MKKQNSYGQPHHSLDKAMTMIWFTVNYKDLNTCLKNKIARSVMIDSQQNTKIQEIDDNSNFKLIIERTRGYYHKT